MCAYKITNLIYYYCYYYCYHYSSNSGSKRLSHEDPDCANAIFFHSEGAYFSFLLTTYLDNSSKYNKILTARFLSHKHAWQVIPIYIIHHENLLFHSFVQRPRVDTIPTSDIIKKFRLESATTELSIMKSILFSVSRSEATHFLTPWWISSV